MHPIFVPPWLPAVLFWTLASRLRITNQTGISGILLAYEIGQIMHNANLSGFGTEISMNASGRNKILFITHGPGRGRNVPTGDVFLNRLAAKSDPLLKQIRIHRTGDARADLTDVGLVVFWLGDPLMQKYPACYLDAMAIADDAADRGIRILNHPDALSNTTKSVQAEIWAKAGVASAAAAPVANSLELPGAIDRVGFPCIVRSDEEHAQRHVATLFGPQDVPALDSKDILPAVVLHLYDIREEYRQSDPSDHSLFSRYHHKARAFVIGDRVMASHLFFSPERIVGLSNCLFQREASRPRRMARCFGYHQALLNQLLEADDAYFNGPVQGASELVGAVKVLGLDFAAVDYSIQPDGRIIVWEANPYFWLPDGKASVLSRQRNAVARVDQTFDWFAACIKTYCSELPYLSVVSST